MNKIAVYLNRQIRGNVYDKPSILKAYSSDRSILEIKPRFVAVPETTDDIRKLCRFINQLAVKDYKLPIAVRGSGLDATGADLTSGLVISTERLNKIKEIDAHDRLVHVQAGVTLGELNSALASHGLILPVNSDPRETIGGLIANASTDSYAFRFGGIMNYVDRIETVLASGDIFQTSRFGQRGFSRRKAMTNIQGTIYRDLNRLLGDHQSTIESLRGTRNTAGYPAIQYVSRDNGRVFDPLPVFFGSQGTLGMSSEVILRAELIPPKPTHLVVVFNSFRLANDFLAFAKKLRPLELDFYDLNILKVAEEHGKRPDVFNHIGSEGYLVYLTFCDKYRINRRKVERCLEYLPKSARYATESDKDVNFSSIFNILSSYLNGDANNERTPFVSDFYVPADELVNFVSDLHYLEEKYKIPLSIYGSYGTSIYSIRPNVQISSESGRRFIVDFLTDFNKLLKMHYGYLCGGSPEGRIKALLTNRELNVAEKKLYHALKDTFDPNHILAPDIKLGADPRSVARHFRTSENTTIMV